MHSKITIQIIFKYEYHSFQPIGLCTIVNEFLHDTASYCWRDHAFPSRRSNKYICVNGVVDWLLLFMLRYKSSQQSNMATKCTTTTKPAKQYSSSTIKLQLLHPLPQPATQILLTATLTLRTTKKRDRIICLFLPRQKSRSVNTNVYVRDTFR